MVASTNATPLTLGLVSATFWAPCVGVSLRSTVFFSWAVGKGCSVFFSTVSRGGDGVFCAGAPAWCVEAWASCAGPGISCTGVGAWLDAFTISCFAKWSTWFALTTPTSLSFLSITGTDGKWCWSISAFTCSMSKPILTEYVSVVIKSLSGVSVDADNSWFMVMIPRSFSYSSITNIWVGSFISWCVPLRNSTASLAVRSLFKAIKSVVMISPAVSFSDSIGLAVVSWPLSSGNLCAGAFSMALCKVSGCGLFLEDSWATRLSDFLAVWTPAGFSRYPMTTPTTHIATTPSRVNKMIRLAANLLNSVSWIWSFSPLFEFPIISPFRQFIRHRTLAIKSAAELLEDLVQF